MARLILLDRDGVINLDSPEFVKTPQEWQAIPGSLEAIAQLKNSGRRVAVCSNQSGVARGIVSLDMLKAIENKMLSELQSYGAELDLVLYCTHHPDEQCGCRKPAPGMLENAMSMLAIDTADTCFVGDSLRDIQAAEAAGCQPVLVKTGNGMLTIRQLGERGSPDTTRVFADLAEFARAEAADSA
jgi:D-glycero-D-manno-heptose 1,7-bisphosphate phosphatase